MPEGREVSHRAPLSPIGCLGSYMAMPVYMAAQIRVNGLNVAEWKMPIGTYQFISGSSL
jgi:hypothetical protein